jgi:hypothetical protein
VPGDANEMNLPSWIIYAIAFCATFTIASDVGQEVRSTVKCSNSQDTLQTVHGMCCAKDGETMEE